MKIGYEVEGRFKGLYTLFMNSEHAVTFFEFKSLKERAFPPGSADSIEKVKHVYVSDSADQPFLMNGVEDCFLAWNEMGMPVTYETAYVGDRDLFPPNVHIMLRIDGSLGGFESFWKLRLTDQVKFSKDQTVFCVAKENMTVTLPHEFMDDIEFDARSGEEFRK
jgi:hypothetical protein